MKSALLLLCTSLLVLLPGCWRGRHCCEKTCHDRHERCYEHNKMHCKQCERMHYSEEKKS